MPSHCFIKVRAALEPSTLEQDLVEIVARRFCGLLTIKRNSKPGEICDWTITFNEVYTFPICLKTADQIDLERPDNNWSRWAQLVIEDILAIKYDATITDQEYPKANIKPSPEIHSTFLTYLEATMTHHSPQWKEALINIEMSHLPYELRSL